MYTSVGRSYALYVWGRQVSYGASRSSASGGDTCYVRCAFRLRRLRRLAIQRSSYLRRTGLLFSRVSAVSRYIGRIRGTSYYRGSSGYVAYASDRLCNVFPYVMLVLPNARLRST